jgi:uncharacterized membrane-anchored protein YitT (DUF2179 family)
MFPGTPGIVRAVLFGAHTIAAYCCAWYVAPWLVFFWFVRILPILGISAQKPYMDWYLQHLALMTVSVDLVAGYVAARFISARAALWVWAIPVLVMGYKMLVFESSHSVLIGNSMSAFRYYFEIVPELPQKTNLFVLTRLLRQLAVTAPFYSGVGYGLGALAVERRVFERLLGPKKTYA